MIDFIRKKEVFDFLTELHNIARYLGKPIDDPMVMVEYEHKHHDYSIDISNTVVKPMFPPPETNVELSPL